MRPQDREEVALESDSVGLPASAHGQVGSMALQGEPEGPAGAPERVMSSPEDLALVYEAGVEPKARSQWAYARIRFFRHKMAVISLFVLILDRPRRDLRGTGRTVRLRRARPLQHHVRPDASRTSTCSAPTCSAATI